METTKDTKDTKQGGHTPARWDAEEHAIFKREYEAQSEDTPFQDRVALAQVLIHKLRRRSFLGPSQLPWNAAEYRKQEGEGRRPVGTTEYTDDTEDGQDFGLYNPQKERRGAGL